MGEQELRRELNELRRELNELRLRTNTIARIRPGGGAGTSDLVYTEEETNPASPVSGKFNVNRQPSTGHFWVYDFTNTAWRRMMGYH